MTIFTFICDLIIPIIMLFFGFKFKNHGPKNINQFYGYRTQMSMKNKETWEFAHKYCGRLWRKLGFIMIIISVAFSFMSLMSDNKAQSIINVTLISIQTIVLIASILPVEKELKNNFDKNGNRRS